MLVQCVPIELSSTLCDVGQCVPPVTKLSRERETGGIWILRGGGGGGGGMMVKDVTKFHKTI